MKELIEEYSKKNGKKSESDITGIANSDFRSKYIPTGTEPIEEKFSGAFIPGKIYVFDYFTETKISSSNKFIDYNPIALFCETNVVNGDSIDFFIDINVIPMEYRNQIIDRIYSAYEAEIKNNIKNITGPQKPLDVRYGTIKNLLGRTGFEFAYSGFKRKYMRNVRVIDYKDWPMVLYLNINKIKGDSINEIYRRYRAKMNS
jgi:hypothetical protein